MRGIGRQSSTVSTFPKSRNQNSSHEQTTSFASATATSARAATTATTGEGRWSNISEFAGYFVIKKSAPLGKLGFDPLYFDTTHSRLTPVRRKRGQILRAEQATVSPYFSLFDFGQVARVA